VRDARQLVLLLRPCNGALPTAPMNFERVPPKTLVGQPPLQLSHRAATPHLAASRPSACAAVGNASTVGEARLTVGVLLEILKVLRRQLALRFSLFEGGTRCTRD
jgi:hypothetical protein